MIQPLLDRPPEGAPPSDRLSPLWWFWLPLAALVFLSLTSMLAPSWYEATINREIGGIEVAQALLLLIALVVALMTLRPAYERAPRWVFALVVLATLCTFYVAGEEVSWGQQIVGWVTPESWSQINDQNETNLHNTSSWFDQKPRLLLGIAIGIGGIGVPLLAAWRQHLRRHWLAIALPPMIALPLASMAIFVGIVWTIDGLRGGRSLFIRPSEVQELFFYAFVLLYLVILRRRIWALPPPGVLR